MRLAFVTDLHIGATPTDFHYQPYWLTGHATIVAALRRFVVQQRIDLLLLGGDMTHNTRPEELAQFADYFSPIETNMVLCLGNHDVSASPTTDHLAVWQKTIAPHKNLSLAPYWLRNPAIDLLALNTCWELESGNTGLYWELGKVSPNACLREEDLAWLDQQLATDQQKPAILMIHAELDALPPTLTGEPQPIHVPAAGYVKCLNELLDRHPRVKLVLSGHNHVILATWHDGPKGRRLHLTTGSMSETPFAVRLLDVTPSEIRVTTHALIQSPATGLTDPVTLRPWAVGRPEDKTVVVPLH